MAEALVFFVEDTPPVSETDIDEYATRGAEVWRAVINATLDPAGDL